MTPRLEASDGESVKSALRSVNLLEFLAGREGVPARPFEIADALGAPRSSVHALLRTLTGAGWTRLDSAGGAYTLGLRSLLVGASFLDSDPYVRLARPVLLELREELGETVHLARYDRGRVVYLVTQESGRGERKLSRVGRSLPAHATSLGKAILAARPDAAPAEPLESLTERTLTTREELERELAAVRQRGYATDQEEGTPGVVCVGVALPYTDPVEDALSCSAPAARMPPDRFQATADALSRTAALLVDMAPPRGASPRS
jgi:DNA-binding IclR family transcriptional regulator